MMIRHLTRTLWILAGLLMLSACDAPRKADYVEVESKYYLAAKQKVREGDYEQALQNFLKVIERYPESPESHLEAGVIYLQQESEPVMAIYHFNEYLRLKPDSREAPFVEELILSAKKRFAESLPGNPFKNAVNRMELLETIAALKKQMETINTENLSLKKQNAELKAQLNNTRDTMRGIFSSSANETTTADTSTNSVESQPLLLNQAERQQVQAVIPAQTEGSRIPETYQVKPGDSLYAISKNFYGDADHIQAIFQANRNILQSVNDLRPGQVLVLPR